jgi:hypothetical protein
MLLGLGALDILDEMEHASKRGHNGNQSKHDETQSALKTLHIYVLAHT